MCPDWVGPGQTCLATVAPYARPIHDPILVRMPGQQGFRSAFNAIAWLLSKKIPMFFPITYWHVPGNQLIPDIFHGQQALSDSTLGEQGEPLAKSGMLADRFITSMGLIPETLSSLSSPAV